MKFAPSISHSLLRLRFIAVFAAFIFVGGSTLFAQGPDVEKYLRSKDDNADSRIQPEEMSSKIRDVITDIGLKPTRTYKISTIVRYYNKKKGIESPKDASQSKSERKVPGFGVDKSESKSTVTGSRTSSKNNESISRQADGLMRRYDKNKNGVFDPDEMKKIPWGSPDPRQSDLNRDGRISRSELTKRLALKASQRIQTSASRRSSSSTDEKRRKDAAERREREREKYKRSTGSSGSSSSARSTTSGGGGSTAKSKVDPGKYEKYAASIIKRYDKDSDGKLSKDELGKMRRPPTGADKDKDGFVTKSELLDSLMGVKDSSSKADKKSTTSKSESSRSSRYSSRKSSSRAGSFEELDANKDKQIQMHEYSSDWSESIVEAYYKIDRNGDGVITLREWSERSK